ncbi:MAG TPA: aspartate-semialdehyde dehydrogenase [Thermoleophilaceae bacterium]|nr:aspartate-semialdehyde dehydrogenase [Thermoleophilaceae bacterium]
MRLAVVGATGAVGTVMLEVLAERSFPADEVVLFASERSAGRRIPFGGAELEVQALTDESVQGFDIAIFSAGGGTSGEWAPRFAAAGAVVVDNSSRWRMEDGVPLVVADVNPEALDSHDGIVANPNCSTMQMMVPLRPIRDAAGIERLVVTTMQSVSGTGQKAIDELRDQTHALLHDQEAEASVYPHRIAFNVLPQAGSFPDGGDYTDEELKLVNETRKILGDETIGVSATCTRVPVFVGHSESVNVQTRDPLSPEECRELLLAAPGIAVLDDPGDGLYPLATAAAGRDEVLVGRIRRDPSHERCLNMWIVGDNLRIGAATNAVMIAERLIERGLTGSRGTPQEIAP